MWPGSSPLRAGRTARVDAVSPARTGRCGTPWKRPRVALRGREGRAFLPLDACADALLRHLLGLGPVAQEQPGRAERFDWRLARWYLHVPMIRVSSSRWRRPPISAARPGRGAGLDGRRPEPRRSRRLLRPLRGGSRRPVLLRAVPGSVRPRAAQGAGVWYTPPEIVRYMVARVDTVLREELGIPDGLADPRVSCSTPAAARAPIWSKC